MTHAVMHAEVGSHVAPSTSERRVLIVAWIITILLSSVPNILWQETMHRGTPWLFRGKLMLVLALLAFSAFVFCACFGPWLRTPPSFLRYCPWNGWGN